MNRLILIVAAVLVVPPLVLPGCTRPTSDRMVASPCDSPTTFLLVRHAERLDGSDDTPLNDAGRLRAEALREVLRDAHVDRIVVSPYRRTHDTATPLADLLGLDLVIDSTSAEMDSARSLMLRLWSEHPGETVLVVGHSNTVPAMLGALTGSEPPELEGYGDLYVITVMPTDEAPRLLRARFGA